MNKKSWLVILVVVLVAFGIYNYGSGVGLGPFSLEENSEASAKNCGSYDLVSSLDKNSLEECTTAYREEINRVARMYFPNIKIGDNNQGDTRSVGENCVGDANVDGVVNQEDIDAVFDNWGKCRDCDADVHPENEGME